MSNSAVVVVGSYAVGLTVRTTRAPLPGETVEGWGFSKMHGGKGSNQAVACARLGASVAFVASVGDDDEGHAARKLHADEGVNTSSIQTCESLPTGVGFIIVDEAGENQIVVDFGANRALKPQHIEELRGRFQESSVWLTQLEIEPETAAAAMKIGRATGATTILNPAPFRPLSSETWPNTDIITPNESEARALLDMDDNAEFHPEKLAEKLLAKGVGAVAMTLGSRGAFLCTPSFAGMIRAPEVDAVDTTGAGDTFAAALAVALSEGRELPDAVRFAVDAAAISVTRYGVIPSLPTRSQVEALSHSARPN